MRRLLAGLCLLLLAAMALPATAATPAPTKHVLLVDGSGSMEDPQEQVLLYSSGRIQALVRDLVAVDGAFTAADQIAVGIFSKTDPSQGINSPVWVYRGTVGALRSGWPALVPPKGWTDLVGTVDAGVAELKNHHGQQLLWLLTDNIDQAVDSTDSTDQFYLNLAGRTDLDRIYVFPVDLHVTHGLVLYAMALERSRTERPAGDARLDAAVAAINASPLRPDLGDGGFLVRPLADQALDVAVTGFTADAGDGPAGAFARDPNTGEITLSGYAEGQPVRGKFNLTLTSRFPALRITDARIEAEMTNLASTDFGIAPVLAQKISPDKVSLGPGQKAEYTIDLNIDPPALNWNPLRDPGRAFADDGLIHGEIRLVVHDVKFRAVEPDKYFKVASIPEVLGNRSQVVLPVSAPITIHVALPWWRSIVLLGIPVAIVALLALLYSMTMGRRRQVRVYTSYFDNTAVVSLRRRPEVPGFGALQGTFAGGVRFVPERKTGERAQALGARNGTISFRDGRSFTYEFVVRQHKRGGHKRGRAAAY